MNLVSRKKTTPVLSLKLIPAPKESAARAAAVALRDVMNNLTSFRGVFAEINEENIGIVLNEVSNRFKFMHGVDDRIMSILHGLVAATGSVIANTITFEEWEKTFNTTFHQLENIYKSRMNQAAIDEERVRRENTVDISDRWTDFKFTESDEKSDKVSITLNNHDLSLLDEPLLRKNNIMEMQWGYPGNMSPTHRCVIKRVTGATNLSIEALSLSMAMHETKRTRIFENKSKGEVALAIAREYGFTDDEIHIGDEEHKAAKRTYHQKSQTDAQFLVTVAGPGSRFYVDNDGFHFKKQRYDQDPICSYTWFTAQKNAEFIEFSIDYDTVSNKGGSQKKQCGIIDPKTKKEEVVTASDKETVHEDAGKHLDARGNETIKGEDGAIDWAQFVSKPGVGWGDSDKSVEPGPEDTKEKAKERLDGQFKDEKHEVLRLSATVVGNPALHAKSMVEFKNISKTYSGLYYVKECSHQIGSGGYTTSLVCRRGGFNDNMCGDESGALTNDSSTDGNADDLRGYYEVVSVRDRETGELIYTYKDSINMSIEPGSIKEPGDDPRPRLEVVYGDDGKTPVAFADPVTGYTQPILLPIEKVPSN